MHVILHERGQGAEGGTDVRREKEAIIGPAILSAQGQQTCLAFVLKFQVYIVIYYDYIFIYYYLFTFSYVPCRTFFLWYRCRMTICVMASIFSFMKKL